MTAAAIGWLKVGSPLPQPSMSGVMPAPIATLVMMMGRARLWQASMMASWRGRPSRFSAMML